MQVYLSADVLPGELAQIVESVFATMTNLEVSRCEAPWFLSEDRLTSAVHLSGDWNGAALFECNRRQACNLAGRFLSMDPPDTVDDVVRDVLGELANMIGGNMKCVIPRGAISLSMPSVVDGSNYSLRVCGAALQVRMAFQSDEGVFWVTVVATEPREPEH